LSAEPQLTIGQLAQRAGINTSAIRFYERNGVLPPAERISGQRRYSTEALHRLEVIDTAKRAGFTLGEARLLLETDRSPELHEQLRALAQRKLPQVEDLLARAHAMRAWLQIASTCSCESLDACALFDAKTPGAEALASSVHPRPR
jgi:MerR family transcriptional regulator, redox-sensitive transcriptional activator SoxR